MVALAAGANLIGKSRRFGPGGDGPRIPCGVRGQNPPAALRYPAEASARAGEDSPSLARLGWSLSPLRALRRDSRRTLHRRAFWRAVRASGGHRAAARDAANPNRPAAARLGFRSTQPDRHSHAGFQDFLLEPASG